MLNLVLQILDQLLETALSREIPRNPRVIESLPQMCRQRIHSLSLSDGEGHWVLGLESPFDKDKMGH